MIVTRGLKISLVCLIFDVSPASSPFLVLGSATMFLSPDPLLTFQGERGTFRGREQIQWKDTITKIRELYTGHKFKQCAALCDQVLVNKPVRLPPQPPLQTLTCQAHPLHETFLHFYAAICHESLGLLAHKYSNNKLSLLDQAQDHFTTALAALPLPYCTTKFGKYDCIEDSPRVLKLTPTPSSIYDPITPTAVPQISIICEASENAPDSDSEDEGSIFSVPDFNKYTARKLDFNISPVEDEGDTLPPYELTYDQRKRLSQSLSAGHIVQEALLPKPLFVKKASSLPPPPVPRALPPIPTRDPILRKTALQTLLNPSVFEILDSSPMTPRFNRIRDAFDPKFSQASQDRHLARYNRLLSSFRTQLLQHIAAIEANISKTRTLQIEHQKNRSSRLASFWSLKQEDIDGRGKKERIERLRNSGWDVSKRAHGWKGKDYYEELRSSVLADLGD